MIASLTGKLIESNLTKIILDVGGVGYQVFIPMSTYDKLPRVGEVCTVLTYMNVREDDISLYGFAKSDEKVLFEALISVSGIGAKVALNILSSMPVSNFCLSIEENDIKSIVRINGIGKKTAERLVLELKDKISKLSIGTTSSSTETGDAEMISEVEDTILALEALGFKREKASKTVKKLATELPKEELSSENLLRKAISKLNN